MTVGKGWIGTSGRRVRIGIGRLFEEHADQVAAAGDLVVDELAGQQVIERGGGGVEVGRAA